ncbi:hypothetical protein [Granulicella arctica]|uniref:hypothetical protein n=1 Tax=Granulicella arctica TaxID=940613 RepID=UPI0021E0A0DE|nr:hypothetical protein [Granulicella arctica]
MLRLVSLLALCGAGWIGVAQGQGTAPAPVPGSYMVAKDYVNPATPPEKNSFPALAPWNFGHIVTHRQTYSDMLNGGNVYLLYQHGGANFLGSDLGLPTKIVGHNINASAFGVGLNANTDVQGGGTESIDASCYGHGDCIGLESTISGTGSSRPTDEGTKLFRMFAQFRGNNWGISIRSITVDAMGQAILTPMLDGKGLPLATAAHDLNASMENGPLIIPAKAYAAGNATLIAHCPVGTPNPQFYMCVTLDKAVPWGLSRMTVLGAELGDGGGVGIDRFAKGPVCADVPVGDPSIFKAGQVFTISSAGDNFEMPSVLSVGAQSIHACFEKPHAKGELMTTGGAVAHGLSFPVDDMLPHTMPGVSNTNDSTLRLAYPVVASLPGNVMMVWVNSAFALELKTAALMANKPRQAAAFTPILDSAGRLASWKIASYGDYLAASAETTGQDYLPPPAITFSGRCAVMPTAHMVPIKASNSQVNYQPVTDSPGSGCATLTATVQASYPNPAVLYPMLWARSNRDPLFVNSADYEAKGINASTDGHMEAGGTTPDFAPGDQVEFGRWWQNYVGNTVASATPMGKSGIVGNGFDLTFTNVNANSLLMVSNYTDAAKYWGNKANGFTPGLHGEGSMTPPAGFALFGAYRFGLAMPVPRGRSGIFDAGAVISVNCYGWMPCSQGSHDAYNWIRADSDGGEAVMQFDPFAHTLHFTDNSSKAVGMHMIFDSMEVLGPVKLKVPGTGHTLCIADDGTLSRSTGPCP